MEKISSLFTDVTNVLEKDLRGVQIGCYTIALTGLAVALRNVRPFSKFKKPSDIPNHFIKERRELAGVVKRIEPNGALLMVQHKPLVNVPFVPSGELPVKISGINVTGLGINWLQVIVAKHEVKLIPITKEKDFVQCEVLLQQPSKDKKKEITINVGESLVKIGFGLRQSMEKPLDEDPIYLMYYNRLRKAEKFAIHRKLGLRYYIKPTKEVILVMLKQLYIILGYTFKQASKLTQKMPKLYAA